MSLPVLPGLDLVEDVGIVDVVLDRIGDGVVSALLAQLQDRFVMPADPLVLHLSPDLVGQILLVHSAAFLLREFNL